MQQRRSDHRPRVAIIDDDASIRVVMREMLQDDGYHVLLWDGLEDPLAFMQRCQPDLVIQDARLGSSHTVWNVLDYLDAMLADSTPQVIVCSADREFLTAHGQTLRDRSCAVVEKPFDIDSFLEAVASCLGILR